MRTESGLDLVIVNQQDPDKVGESELTLELPESLTVSEVSQLTGESYFDVNDSKLVALAAATDEHVATVPAGSATLIRLTSE